VSCLRHVGDMLAKMSRGCYVDDTRKHEETAAVEFELYRAAPHGTATPQHTASGVNEPRL